MTALTPQTAGQPPRPPPLKIQGIKTKLVPFIRANIQWEQQGQWVEPFLGSAAVLLNITPHRALAADSCPPVITFYHDLQSGKVTPQKVEQHLLTHGEKLRTQGDTTYHQVRDRYNDHHNSLDFLSLNRAALNGLIRFNRKGGYNSPFCHRPNRFARAHVTRICNQVRWAQETIAHRDWQFVCADWSQTLRQVTQKDLIYADPPYTPTHPTANATTPTTQPGTTARHSNPPTPSRKPHAASSSPPGYRTPTGATSKSPHGSPSTHWSPPSTSTTWAHRAPGTIQWQRAWYWADPPASCQDSTTNPTPADRRRVQTTRQRATPIPAGAQNTTSRWANPTNGGHTMTTPDTGPELRGSRRRPHQAFSELAILLHQQHAENAQRAEQALNTIQDSEQPPDSLKHRQPPQTRASAIIRAVVIVAAVSLLITLVAAAACGRL